MGGLAGSTSDTARLHRTSPSGGDSHRIYICRVRQDSCWFQLAQLSGPRTLEPLVSSLYLDGGWTLPAAAGCPWGESQR